MSTLIIISLVTLVIYIGIGAWTFTYGPLHGWLHRFRWDMSVDQDLRKWAKEIQNESSDVPPSPPVSRWRWRALWLSVHVITALGWPLFLPEAWKAQRKQRQEHAEWKASRS